MAIKFNRSQTFATNGTVTAAGLHNLIDGTDIYQALITDQTNLTSVGTADELLIADADLTSSDAPRAITIQNLFDSGLTAGTYTGLNLTGALSYGTATGNRTISTSATITSGTITNGTITNGTINNATFGTTTATASTITSGTIPTLTAGTTTSTAATITTGTIATLNSTTGTIATLNSTAATITTGTIPTLVSTTLVTTGTGTAAAPAIVPTGDSNTGVFFPAADTIAFAAGGAEAMRIDSNGRLGIGTTTPATPLDVNGAITADSLTLDGSGSNPLRIENAADPYIEVRDTRGTTRTVLQSSNGLGAIGTISNHPFRFLSANAEQARIDVSGNFLFSKSATDLETVGVEAQFDGAFYITRNGGSSLLFINRLGTDGTLVSFRQAGTQEGTIQVSGTTVSYNGGHLSRFSQLPTGQRDPLLKKGTVLSNLDAMCEWRDSDGNLLPNEQLNKVKISDIDGDSNVAGVFVNWDNDDQDNPFDLNMAMTGDMIIRIAQGVIVSRGDLLMSAGDGTAKPQGDDIVRSKTIAKVISTNVTCTYDDGSYCVPCVLMAC